MPIRGAIVIGLIFTFDF